MDHVISFGFIIALLIGTSHSQSCPENPNVARVCTAATYTGSRVMMDTASFTDSVQNCSCTFTTTADSIRIVTYAAPNYQQCNSAIRFYSSSGNSMRFQCLMSGTYLDTSIHKDGGAEFEPFGPMYDKNYCLVLEHLGSAADTITISCEGDEPASADVTTPAGSIAEDLQPNLFQQSTEASVNSVSGVIGSLRTASIDVAVNTTENNITKDIPSQVLLDNQKDLISNESGTFISQSAPEKTAFGNDAIPSIDRTTTHDPRRHWTDSVVVRSRTVTPDAGVSFGNDLIAKESVTPFLDLLTERSITFENDAIVKDENIHNQGYQTTTSRQQDATATPLDLASATGRSVIAGSFKLNKTDSISFQTSGTEEDLNRYTTVKTNSENVFVSQNELTTKSSQQTFGPDIITKERALFGQDTMPIGTTDNSKQFDHTVMNDANTTDQHAWATDRMITDRSTFGNDAIPIETVTRETFGNDILLTNTTLLGSDAIPKDKLTDTGATSEIDFTTAKVRTFRNDAVVKETSTVRSANLLMAGRRAPVPVSEQSRLQTDRMTLDRATFGNDAIPRNDVGNVTPTNDSGMGREISVLGGALDKTLDILSFKNESRPTVTTIEIVNEIATFGNDAIPKDIVTPQTGMVGNERSAIGNVVHKSDLGNDSVTRRIESLVFDGSSRDIITKDANSSGSITSTQGPSWFTNPMVNDRATFGNDALPKDVTTPQSSVITNERVAFGNDAIPKDTFDNVAVSKDLGREISVLGGANDKTLDILSFKNESRPTVPTIEITNRRATLGNDALPRDSVTPQTGVVGNDKPMFGNDVVHKNEFGNDAVTRRIDSLAFDGSSRDIITEDPNSFGSITSTQGPSWFTNPMVNDRATFGNDALQKDVTTPQSSVITNERIAFGNDAIPTNDLGNDVIPRINFGNDAVSKDLGREISILGGALDKTRDILSIKNQSRPTVPTIEITNEKATFGNDAIPRDIVTPQTGGVVNDKPNDRVQSGNDAVLKDATTSQPDMFGNGVATVGNNALPKDTLGNNFVTQDSVMGREISVIGFKNESQPTVSSILELTNDRVTFGNDAIQKDATTSQPDIFGNDMDRFGNNAMQKDTFGNDAVNKDIGMDREILEFGFKTDSHPTLSPQTGVTENNKIVFGNDAVTRKIGSLAFDGSSRDVITKDPNSSGSITSTQGPSWFTNPMVNDRATFGNDAIPKDVTTPQSSVVANERIAFGNDAIPTNDLGNDVTPRIDFGNDAVSKDLGREISILGGALDKTLDILSIKNESRLTEPTIEITNERATFGNDAIPRDSVTPQTGGVGNDTPKNKVQSGNDAVLKDSTTSQPDMFGNGVGTVGNNALPKDTFGNDFFTKDSVMGREISVIGFKNELQPTVSSMLELTNDRVTFGNDAIQKGASTSQPDIFGNDMNHFGNNAMQKDTFGNDAVKNDIDMDQEIPVLGLKTNSHPTLSPQTSVMENDKTMFGNDAVARRIDSLAFDGSSRDVITKDPNSPGSITSTQGPSWFTNPMVNDRAEFGNDAIPKDITTPQSSVIVNERVAFGNEAVPRNDFGNEVTPRSDVGNVPTIEITNERATFGNDAIPRDIITPQSDVMESDKRLFGKDVVTTDILGNDAVSKDLGMGREMSVLSGESDKAFDILSIKHESQQTVPTVEITNERATFGNDAIEKDTSASQRGISGIEMTTFGTDTIPKVAFVNDAITKDMGMGRDISVVGGTRDNTLDILSIKNETRTTVPTIEITNEKATFGNDAIQKDTTTPHSGVFGNEINSFGNDALPKDTFGNDAFSKDTGKELSLFGLNNNLQPTIPDITTERSSFGNDAIPRNILTPQTDVVESENGMFGNEAIHTGGFGNDAIITNIPNSDRITSTESPAWFNNPAIGDQATFGNDAIIKETVNPVHFGNDAVLKENVNIGTNAGVNIGDDAIHKTSFMLSSIVRDIITTKPVVAETVSSTESPLFHGVLMVENTTFGNDAVAKENKIEFSNDVVLRESVAPNVIADALQGNKSSMIVDNMADQKQSIGGDVMLKAGGSIGQSAFGNDAILKDITTTEASRVTEPKFVGNALSVLDSLMNTQDFGVLANGRNSLGNDVMPRNTFGSDAVPIDSGREISVIGFNNEVQPTDSVLTSERSTFGNDAIPRDVVTPQNGIVGSENGMFGNDAIPRDIVTPQNGIVGSENGMFGNDAIPRDIVTPQNGIVGSENGMFGNDAVHMGGFGNDAVNNDMGSMVFDGSSRDIITNIPNSDRISPTESPAWFNNPAMGNQATFGNDAIIKENVNPMVSNGDSVGGSTFDNDAILNGVTSNQSPGVMETKAVGSALSVLENLMNTQNIDPLTDSHSMLASDTHLPINNVISETNISEAILSNDVMLVNNADDITTTQSAANVPVIEETISKQTDGSLLNSINQVRPESSNSLMDSLLNTHSETLSGLNENPLNSLMGTILVDTTTDRIPVGPDTVTRSIVTDIDRNDVGQLTTAPSIVTDKLPEIPNIDGKVLQTETTVSNIVDTTLDETATTAPHVVTESTVETSTITETTTSESVKPPTTLPDIVPGVPTLTDAVAPGEELDPVIRTEPTTQKPVRTTKKEYDIMVDQFSITKNDTVIDDGPNTKTSKDQLNVSFEDEPNSSFFDTDNKTNIIIVIAVAGCIVVVAVIAVVICNRKNRRSAKADINNGVSSSNHNNAAFDNGASEAERGNAPGNGLDLPKPTVEVIEPTVNGSDNKVP